MLTSGTRRAERAHMRAAGVLTRIRVVRSTTTIRTPGERPRKRCARKSGLLAIWRLLLCFFLLLFLYYPTQGFQHLQREADHAALLAPYLHVQGLVIVVDEHF